MTGRSLLLALETSTAVGSVAVGAGSRVAGAARLGPQGDHAARLVPAIRHVLARAGAAPADLAGIVVGAGPGSFTGVRVAAATAKGLVRALGTPLWAFSSLAAGALTAADAAGTGAASLRVLFVARGDRVYAAWYGVAGGGLEARAEPVATTVGAVLREAARGDPSVFAGDGAVRHREALRAAGHAVLPEPAGAPTAEALLRLLASDPYARPVPGPGRWEPIYLRASGAEREAAER